MPGHGVDVKTHGMGKGLFALVAHALAIQQSRTLGTSISYGMNPANRAPNGSQLDVQAGGRVVRWLYGSRAIE